jgi:hypothetical protein
MKSLFYGHYDPAIYRRRLTLRYGIEQHFKEVTQIDCGGITSLPKFMSSKIAVMRQNLVEIRRRFNDIVQAFSDMKAPNNHLSRVNGPIFF